MQKLKIGPKTLKSVILLTSLLALTACPDNGRAIAPVITPQAIPPAANPPTGNPIAIDPSIKSFMCEYEAERNNRRTFFRSSVTFYGNREQKIDLRTKFLGMDFGKFGAIYMRYVPAKKSGTDTIVLVDEGLNKNMRMSQSGFAGQEVKLEAQDYDLSLSIACKGTTQFKSVVDQTAKTNLICKGKSGRALSPVKEFEEVIPLSSIQDGEQFEIAEALGAKLDRKTSTISYIGDVDPGRAPMVLSTASLKSATTFKIVNMGNGHNSIGEIYVICNLK